MNSRPKNHRSRRAYLLRTAALCCLFLACSLPASIQTATPSAAPTEPAVDPAADTPIAALDTPTASIVPSSTSPPTATAVPSSTPESTPPDLILFNAHIVTMNPEQPQAQAIAIAGTTIVALGTQEQILGLAIDGTIRLDLEGRTVYPGFIDSHSHWIGDRHVGGYETAEAVLAYAISLGWTSINELFVDQARLDELLALDAAGLLPMRVNAYLPINFTDDKFGEWYLEHPPGTDLSPHVRIAGIKLFMDHGWGENIHWTQSELNEYVLHAHENGYQVAAHTVGHDSLDMLLNAQAHALEMVPDLDPRFRIEHAIQVRDDQLQPLLDGGTIASIQLPGPADWPDDDLYQERMADDPLTWLMRWQDFLGFGIPTIGSTDWPWMTPEGYFDIPLTPFLATYMAVTRDGYFKLPVEPYQQAQTLTVEQSLLLLTINGAYGTFEEDRKGSLEPGKFADLVVISADPLTIPVDDLPAIEVLLTMVGGEVVYDTGLFSEE